MRKISDVVLVLSGATGQLLLVLALIPLASDIRDYAPVGWSSFAAIPAAVLIGRLANRRFRYPRAACFAACFTAAFVSLVITSIWLLVWFIRAIDV